MNGSMSFFTPKMSILYGNLVAGPDENAFVPVVEFAIAHPAVFQVFHSNGFVSIIVDFVLMVDEFFRVAFPVATEQNVFNTTFFKRMIGLNVPAC
ncbi:hypothetical protein D3C86_1950050 [compost metagenome]